MSFAAVMKAMGLALEGPERWWNYPGLELWKFLNLFVFVGFLVYLLRRRVRDGFGARREGIRRELLRAQEERDQALGKLAEVETRLGRLDGEVARIREQAKAEALAERERISRSTEAEMFKLREQTQREIENAGKAARHELQRFAAQQSVRLAEEMIRRDIREEDDARLIGLNVEELGRGQV